MKTIQHRPQSLARPGAFPGSDAIEWEELPSLAAALRHSGHASGPVWDVTMPASLEPVFEPDPFREEIAGLATREVREPDVFRHFFV